MRPQGVQRPRLGPLTARGAKPHSLRLTNYRRMSAAIRWPTWKHPRVSQHGAGTVAASRLSTKSHASGYIVSAHEHF